MGARSIAVPKVAVPAPPPIYATLGNVVCALVTVKNVGGQTGFFGLRGRIFGGTFNFNFDFYHAPGYCSGNSSNRADGALDNGRVAYVTLAPGQQRVIEMATYFDWGCDPYCKLDLYWKFGLLDQAAAQQGRVVWVSPELADEATFRQVVTLR